MTKLAFALQALLGLAFLLFGIAKFTGGQEELRIEVEAATWVWYAVGVLELAGAAALLASLKLTRWAAPAALWAAAIMTGAIIAHVRAADISANLIGPVVLLILSLAIVAMRWDLFTLPGSESVDQRG